MIVAQEKTGYYKLSEEKPRSTKKPRGKSLSQRPKLALIGLVLVCFLTGVVITVYCSQVIALGYQITNLEKELALLRIENHNLDEEVHRMTSLEQIESIAVGKLGMVRPDNNNILVVTLDGISQQNGTTGSALKKGQAAGNASAEQEKNPFIRVFTELVNRYDDNILSGPELGV
jgi:cell division protein FtsL